MTTRQHLKTILTAATALIAVLTMATSCLSDDETEIIMYDDAAITSFKIGTLNQTVYTKGSQGQDSSYIKTIDLDTCLFTIDQEKGLIYNLDSLPKGVMTDKCMPTVSTKNSGYAYVKHIDNDSLMYIGGDSIDFSVPRVLRCFANDLSWSKDYTVEVRVHTQALDTLYWYRKDDASHLGALTGLRSMMWGDNIVAYGTDNGKAKAYTTSSKDGNNWTELTMPSASATISMANDGRTLYMLDSERDLYASADGMTWQSVAKGTPATRLLTTSRQGIYALAENGGVTSSADGGVTWTTDGLDGTADALPVKDINAFTTPSRSNADLDIIYLIGNRENAADSTCVVWTKVVDNQNAAATQPWMYQPFTSETWHHAPSVAALSVIPYAGGLMMTGGKGLGTCTERAFMKVWFSRDNGLNWWTDSRLFLPEGMRCSESEFTMVADRYGCVWLICGGTGQVWRGFMSQYTWR
ncbi:MAG: DUF6242 domain-containing protein [Prevotella sp.]